MGYHSVTVAAVGGTLAGMFSFDAAAISSALLNSPHSGGSSVTVSGLSFGAGEHTSTSALSSAACVTSSWTSSSSVACAGNGIGFDFSHVQLTVFAVAGTAAAVLSFDGTCALLL